MPSPLVATLAAPIREVQTLLGPGAHSTELTDVLHRVRIALQEVSDDANQAWRRTAEQWTGPGADAAANHVAAAVARIQDAAERVGRLGSSVETAQAAVTAARERLRNIVEAFEARAAALESHLDSPDTAEELLAEARRSLAEAVAVVEELRAELDGQAAALPSSTAAPAAPAATTPASFGAPMPSSGLGSGGSGLGSGGSPSAGFGSLLRDVAEQASVDTPDAAAFGDGVAVRLPDGSSAMAPNAVAASAVRHALTQLGVPYDWGGTTPGVGLDCSGLTQWAYAEAGLSLPRLAQEQDVGAPVAAGALRPGDLAVWDGHVAMVVGNGQMIEAGDPVKLSPIRTTNIGQGFQGFWRPTA
ncbi:NlpC/P60 family protein [Mycobacterium sp. B14F4]|uniref:C40 family peptidase n=1 Tax=Mycobacterium sp. B14F4 TaxID=3153565 RepID=UPI00325CC0CF